jgi:hypothetical protein
MGTGPDACTLVHEMIAALGHEPPLSASDLLAALEPRLERLVAAARRSAG